MQAWHLFWRTSAKDCFCTGHTHHSQLLIHFNLHSAPSSSSSLLLLRSSRPEVFYKKVVLRNFAKFTRKHLRQRVFFNKVAGLRLFIKKGLWHRCFLVNFAKFLRTPFVTEHMWWLLLNTVNISDVCFWFKFKRLQRI